LQRWHEEEVAGAGHWPGIHHFFVKNIAGMLYIFHDFCDKTVKLTFFFQRFSRYLFLNFEGRWGRRVSTDSTLQRFEKVQHKQ
jgi:hypothetical protein